MQESLLERSEKKLNTKNKKQINCIDGENDIKRITELLSNKYKSILDDPKSKVVPENYDNDINSLFHNNNIRRCNISKCDIVNVT